MEGISLKSRAIAFAFCVGAVAFILALIAGAGAGMSAADISRALIVAIVCAVMSWASAERSVASVAESVDAAIERLSQAAHGDLVSPTPDAVSENLPDLANALDGLLSQVRLNLDSVHTLAMFDPVTALANRTNFRREVGRVLRELPDDTLSALLFIDLDSFKAVNDGLGHAQGDQLLAKVANRLRAVVENDPGRPGRFARDPLIGRLAGDEFTIFFPQISDRDEAERLARRVLYAIAEPFDLAGQEAQISASIGVALRPAHGRALTDLMRAADVAMYHAKESGRGQAKVFSETLAERLADNVQLETDLRLALDRDEFALLYQPQIDLKSGRMIAAEALLRWEHPARGTQAPDSFIGRAEECGLIHEIGEWAIDAVAAALARWDAAGVEQRLAVNVSPRQIARPEFFARVREAMTRSAAPARLLELEITETLAMHCGDAVLAEIARLRAEGATVAVDDFGTGFSNLSRLRELPIDRVKIDRSLIADIIDSERARTLVHSVIGLIHGLGYEVVAEGVEHPSQRTMLAAMGCDIIQGYAIARPMTEAALMDWMAGNHVLTGTR
ncbi:MAG: response regulator PleD [Sphingomonas sp. SCN 67-18]|nr:EAL domain-containing protein [Sphingomonas sp. SCN 67-18]ODU21704.1 MAG: response regulator PleD [Sphingomonas sp. SCN 67-18]